MTLEIRYAPDVDPAQDPIVARLAPLLRSFLPDPGPNSAWGIPLYKDPTLAAGVVAAVVTPPAPSSPPDA